MAVHKSTGGTRGPCDTTAKSLVARGPWEVPVELWAARGKHGAPYPDRARPTGVTTGCAILQRASGTASPNRKQQTMTPTPETIPTPQTDPNQSSRWAFVRSLLSSFVREDIPSAIRGVLNFFFELTEIFLKAYLIFVFVSFCAFFIFAMGDYIFCNSAHAERFRTIINTVTSHMIRNVLLLIGSYWTVSASRKCRTILTKWSR